MLASRLPNWQPNETIVLLLRRHPWVMFRIVLVFLLIVAVPIVAYFLMQSANPDFFDNADTLRTALLTVGVSLYALMAWLFLFTAWVDYYLDVWIVTTERIISMEQHGLFSRTTAEQRLSRVQDVTSIQKGKIPTVLNFGNVKVQTAGTESEFLFEQVPNPDRVAQKILELHDSWLQAHPDATRQTESPGAVK